MRQIIEFIRAGGLQRAREIEMVKLEDARRRAGGEPPKTEPVNSTPIGPLHRSMSSDDRVNFFCGLAWLVGLFT